MKFSIPDFISEQFHIERTLKDSHRGRVLLLRCKGDGSRRVCKQYEGSGEVYALLHRLESPHLSRVEAVITEGERVTVLEEYIGGDSLAALLEGGPLTEAQTVDVTLQLCSALELLHSHGVVHRDIKPENVILRGDTAVLIDFDASRVEKAHSGADTRIMGTAGYAAPEQYGFSQTDARSDIYALGVLMNVMCTKQHPAARLAEGPLGTVIQRCVEVNADRRYPTVTALADALATAAPPQRKRRSGRWLAIAALLCLLLGIGTARTPQPRETAPIVGEAAVFPREEYVIDRDRVSVLQNRNNGAQTVAPTKFLYDADGDGAREEYLFGVSFAAPVSMYGDVVIDEMIGVMPGNTPGRTVIPCVWRYENDGSLRVAEEFIPLLEDVSITVTFAETSDGTHCSVQAASHRWPGAVAVRFPPDTIGTWVYTVTATLGGETITAQGDTVLVYQ